jgi:tryptophan synthase alpha chain
MTRLETLFRKKNQNVLNVYVTAGFPGLNDTVTVMKALEKHGADIIELGIPYSDPLADGPVIQASSAMAISNGMGLEVLFQQLRDLRTEVSIPVVMMGYMNTVLQYGFERFCIDASAIGIDGIILPDLPVYEFEKEYGDIIKEYGLNFIFLVTPETPVERVRKLDSLSSGFLYAVSSSSVTGAEKDMSDVEAYLQRLQSYKLRNPVLAGFGIKDHRSFAAVCRYANGGIIGSAYINAIKNATQIEKDTGLFIRSIREQF